MIDHEYISIDNYNNTANCKLDGNIYVFTPSADFINTTGFPFEVGLLSWEPSRAHWVVERLGTPPTHHYGDSLPEMLWISENREHIKDCCIRYQESQPKGPEYTIRDERNFRLFQTDWIIQRHQEQQLLNLPFSLSDEKLQEFLVYRQALRNMTQTYTSLSTAVWPVNPLE